MGGVRGDVIGLGFIQTKIMEMGQPPAEQSDEPAMWVRSRQYTGRLVTVTNDKIFDEPVFNYSQDFPYIWKRSCCRCVMSMAPRETRQGGTDFARRCPATHAEDRRVGGRCGPRTARAIRSTLTIGSLAFITA